MKKTWFLLQRNAGPPAPAPDSPLFALVEEQVGQETTAFMAFKDKSKTPVKPEMAIHQIRITLTSHNLKFLEKACADLIRVAKERVSK